jgi:long-chain acyl-CoA synthetase
MTAVAGGTMTEKQKGSDQEAAARPWLNSYPANVPAAIAVPSGSIGDLLVKSCRDFASRPAFSCMGKSISYAEIDTLSAAFGAWLQSKGLAKGARVAIMMPNVLQYPIAMIGILRAGYTVVNVNPLYTPRELEHQLKDSGAEAIVILENFAKTLQAVAGRTPDQACRCRQHGRDARREGGCWSISWSDG